MVIVDTSVWIDYFNQKNSREVRLLEKLLADNAPLCINGLIEMELLQGVSTANSSQLKSRLRAFQYFPNIPFSYLEGASEIYRECRRKGSTIRKSIDCIIAANALAEGLSVLHCDRDFDQIAKHFKKLLLI